MRQLTIMIAAIIFSAATAYSAVPQLINYQGHLRYEDTPVTGTKSISFSLFDVETDGAALCDSGAQSLEVTHGLFYYKIGSGGCDLSTMDLGSPVYLELNVEGATLSPREQITGAAYSVETLAANVEVTPVGNITSTDVQAAIEELDDSKLSLSGGAITGDISISGNISASGTISGDGSGLFSAGNWETGTLTRAGAAGVGTTVINTSFEPGYIQIKILVQDGSNFHSECLGIATSTTNENSIHQPTQQNFFGIDANSIVKLVDVGGSTVIVGEISEITAAGFTINWTTWDSGNITNDAFILWVVQG